MQIAIVLYRPDTSADKQKQNMNWLFCNDYRGDEAPAVPNANNKGWTNFSRLIILLPYEVEILSNEVPLPFCFPLLKTTENTVILFPKKLLLPYQK